MNSQTIRNASKLWEYLASFNCKEKSDAIVVCCSYDLRVLDYAYELLQEGIANKIVLSGKTGHWTKQLWEQSEAEIFYNHAQANGYDLKAFILEDQATNIGENIAFSRNLLPGAQAVTFVTKPNTILRVKLSIPIHWKDIQGYTACPNISFPHGISNIVGVFGVISEMVGDIERIMKYPQLGFQTEHSLPREIVQSWYYLIDQGFTHHRMPTS